MVNRRRIGTNDLKNRWIRLTKAEERNGIGGG